MSAHEAPPTTTGAVIHWAHSYDWLVGILTLGGAATLRRAMINVAQIQPGERVLDVGCGTGKIALRARVATGPSGSVVGIDPSPEMIARARDKASRHQAAIDFQIGVVEDLAFPAASFDLIVSTLMMHHLPPDVQRRGLAEMRRVLRPGGRVVIVDLVRPTGQFQQLMLKFAMHGGVRAGVRDLPALVRESGFTRVEAGRLPSFSRLPLGYVRGWVA